jgi:uncharacterized protein YkwD
MRFKIALGFFFAFLILSAQSIKNPGPSLEKLEDDLFFLVNYERSLHRLPELRFNLMLRSMARAHSKKMAQERLLAHDFPGYERLGVRAHNAGLHFLCIGENLAVGTIFIMRLFHEQMLTSPGHRENIFFKGFTDLGIGIESSGEKYYITQEFAGLY